MFLTLGTFWYLYKDANELFNPNASKRTFFHSICPDDRLERANCVRKRTHILYTVSSVDKIAVVIVISICFWHNATFTFSVIKSDVNPAGTKQAHNVIRRWYWLNFGCDVGWPKFNVNPTSNVNVKLMSNSDVSWRWDFVVFRLCNQNPTLSQCQIDVKYWCQPDFHFQPKCNVCLTSCPTSTWRYIDVWCLLGSDWTAVGRAYGERTIRSGGGVYANVCALVMSSCTSDPKRAIFWSLIK